MNKETKLIITFICIGLVSTPYIKFVFGLDIDTFWKSIIIHIVFTTPLTILYAIAFIYKEK